jgi:hypothetical protein
MSHLHLRCLDLVDERGQPGGVEYFPDVDRGPAYNEFAAAILARAAAIVQCGRQLQLVRSVEPSLPSGDLRGSLGLGARAGSRTIHRVSVWRRDRRPVRSARGEARATDGMTIRLHLRPMRVVWVVEDEIDKLVI